MNLANFQILLQEAIDNSTTTIDYLLLSKALQSLNMGQIRAVATYANLPSAASNEGLLVWVVADERLYWSTGVDWYSITTSNYNILYGWGLNTNGQVGNNSTTATSSPVSVVGRTGDWVQISSGCSHSLGVRSNGSAWAWGAGASGRLGDGTTTACRLSPVSVVGGFTDWCQVSAGNQHSVGLRANGTLWAWGSGVLLGNNCTTDRSSPVSVAGGFTDWCQVSAGYQHTVAVRTNGTLWAWGSSTSGRLGNDCASGPFSSPVSVIGGFTDWCQAFAADYHSLGLRRNGSLWAWGSGGYGRLGNDCTSNFSSPVSVVGGFTDWCRISANGNHNLAQRCNGTLWAWGYGTSGQLGNGASSTQQSPVSVVGGFTDWCGISAARRHSVALRTNGTLWVWGRNNNGQLGINSSGSDVNSPVSVAGGFTDWSKIADTNGCHTLAIRSTGFV